MDRSQRREMAFQLLYSIEIQKDFSEDVINLFLENNAIQEEDKIYILDIANGIQDNMNKIKKEIAQNLKKDWEIERISKVNLALLQLAVYEILFKDIPFKVVINEVVELAKRYGEDASSSFINGVLANIVKEN